MEWFEFGHIFVLECCDGVRDGNAERFVVESIILRNSDPQSRSTVIVNSSRSWISTYPQYAGGKSSLGSRVVAKEPDR